MINNREFSERLQTLLQYYSLSASSFAREIEVQRSGISHILSGRNRPSLEFVLKILNRFPEVHFNWLVQGKGNFPALSDQNKPTPKPKEVQPEPKSKFPVQRYQEKTRPLKIKSASEKRIQSIVVLFNDGTFEITKN